jgi:murein DD-endopeptidase MepM/ murein hydrolase activator NlpD
MYSLLAWRPSRRVFRWGLIVGVAAGAAACSADTTRWNDTTHSTAYYAPPPTAAPYQQQPYQPPPYQQPAYQQPPYQQTYQPPPPAPPPVERQTLPPPPPAYNRPPDTTGAVARGGHWEWDGGTAVIVGPGETVDSIARAHHVPARAIVDANGITSPAAILPGQRLVIPRYVPGNSGAKVANAATPRRPAAAAPPPAPPVQHAAAPAPAAPAPHAPAPRVAASPPVDPSLPASAPAGAGQTLLPAPAVHVVASGDTLSRIAHKYRIKAKDLAVANGLQPDSPLKIGMRITVPNKPIAAPKAPLQTAKGQPVAAPPGKPGTAAKPPQGKVAANEQGGKMQVVQPADPGDDEAPGKVANGAPEFRWPLRGRVISKTNDGIDLAVPEGTPVRAADDGVVAYSGNELKGYGNLVLVRHANGFVTAYAHASELLVKRNDQVHKGQVIAKSGQTGTVTSPQLHFEIRKNSSPVDPMQYLPADKTASAPL